MSESKYANLLAEAVANEADTLKKVTPKYAKVALELAVIFEGENSGAKIHAYCCAAQDSTANGDAWNRAVTGLGKALGKLPSPLKFSAKRDFRPTHRDKAPLFSLVLIADANSERKELARVAKEQADAFEAQTAADRAAEQAAIDAATTPQNIADGCISECNRLGLDIGKVAELLAPSDFHRIVDMVVDGAISGTKDILDILWLGFSASQRSALFRLCDEKAPAKKAA